MSRPIFLSFFFLSFFFVLFPHRYKRHRQQPGRQKVKHLSSPPCRCRRRSCLSSLLLFISLSPRSAALFDLQQQQKERGKMPSLPGSVCASDGDIAHADHPSNQSEQPQPPPSTLYFSFLFLFSLSILLLSSPPQPSLSEPKPFELSFCFFRFLFLSLLFLVLFPGLCLPVFFFGCADHFDVALPLAPPSPPLASHVCGCECVCVCVCVKEGFFWLLYSP